MLARALQLLTYIIRPSSCSTHYVVLNGLTLFSVSGSSLWDMTCRRLVLVWIAS